MSQTAKKQNPTLAMLLSLVPGLGQIYNKQVVKGITFLAITGLFIYEIVSFGFGALTGFITLGDTPGVKGDNSLFLMITGTLQIIITIVFLIFLIFNMMDAKRIANLWNENYEM